MSTWSSVPQRALVKIGHTWVCAQDVQAIAQDGDLVILHLASGAEIAVEPGGGQGADWVARQIALLGWKEDPE